MGTWPHPTKATEPARSSTSPQVAARKKARRPLMPLNRRRRRRALENTLMKPKRPRMRGIREAMTRAEFYWFCKEANMLDVFFDLYPEP